MDGKFLDESSTQSESKTKKKEYSNYTDAFEDLWPLYLSYGMSYELYWRGPCYETVAYRKAQEIDVERKNQMLWLQGLYIYQALNTVAFNMFSKSEKQDYLEAPIPITKSGIQQKEERDKLLEEERARQWMESFKNAYSNKG